VTAWTVGRCKDVAERTVTRKRWLRSVWGGFSRWGILGLDFSFCFTCLAAQHDAFQSGVQQAVCMVRCRLREKTLKGDLVLLQSSGSFKSSRRP